MLKLLKNLLAIVINYSVSTLLVVIVSGKWLLTQDSKIALLVLLLTFLVLISATLIVSKRGTFGELILGIIYIPIDMKNYTKHDSSRYVRNRIILRWVVISSFAFIALHAFSIVTSIGYVFWIYLIFGYHFRGQFGEIAFIDQFTGIRQITFKEMNVIEESELANP